MSKIPRAVFAVVAIVLIALSLARAVRCWSNDSHLEHVAGAWVALAVDLKDGVFYRPAFGPLGYGGTRFFPLYFSLHAALIKVFGGWRATGYLLSAASIILLLAGLYSLLRRLGVDRWLAAGGVMALLAASSAQDALLTIREDGMASMFNVWGVALWVGNARSPRRLIVSALLFTLAFATKESSVFGMVAVVIWLVVQNQKSAAIRLLILSAVGYGLVVAGIYFGTHGEAYDLFRATVSSGSSLRRVLDAPGALLQTLPGYWAESVLLPLAGAALVAGPGRKLATLPSLLFICTLGVTLIILSSEGAGGNHLLDLHVAAVVLFITAVAEWSPSFGLSACTVAVLIALVSFIPVYRDVDSLPRRDQYREIADTIGRPAGPILADNPLIPIIAGQRPYVTDAFMLRVIAEKRPAFAEPLWRMLAARQFAAVVLQDNPDTDDGKNIYTHFHFGGDFLRYLNENYQIDGTPGDHYVYIPRR
jgi:hypothetical protein